VGRETATDLRISTLGGIGFWFLVCGFWFVALKSESKLKLTNQKPETRNLFISQRDHRIHLCRPKRRDDTRG
jgi:hypothetical protein